MSHYQNFELPKDWLWVKLEDLVEDLRYGTSEKSLPEGIIAVLRMGNLTNDGRIVYNNLAYSSNVEDIQQYSLKKGDLLFNRTNSSEWVGKTAIYNGDIPAIFAGYLIRIVPILISSEYLNMVMNSSYYRRWCYEVKTDAVNQSNINAQKLSKLWIPVPPLLEQKRIVCEFLRWDDIIELISREKTSLKRAVSSAKSKILDLAIHGKLIPQNPEDEPAMELLKRVNPKARIITDNPHYPQLPDNWVITDLKSIGTWQSGATPSKLIPEYYGKGYKWLNTGDLNDNYVTEIPKEVTELALKKTSLKLNPSGSVLIAMYGATIGKLGILTFPATTNQACCACADCLIDNIFLFYFLKYYRPSFIQMGGGGAQPNISKEKIENTIVGIPPIAEQKRIVARIEELFAALDSIASELEA